MGQDCDSETAALFGRVCRCSTRVVGDGCKCSMVGFLFKDKMWMRMIRVKDDC